MAGVQVDQGLSDLVNISVPSHAYCQSAVWPHIEKKSREIIIIEEMVV
jgi:hypothetical protein